MAKYRKKPIIVSAELFKLGMEDGFKNSLESLGEGIRGVKHVKKPYIKTLEGECIVEIDKHFIVTGIKGERYPVEVKIFHELYDLVDEELENMLKNMPSDSSIFGTERIGHLLKCLQRKTDMM